MVSCLERGVDLHMAQLMPLPLTVSCSNKIQIGITFLVLAHLGSPGRRAVKRVCMCVCLCVSVSLSVSVCVRACVCVPIHTKKKLCHSRRTMRRDVSIKILPTAAHEQVLQSGTNRSNGVRGLQSTNV